jgi:hypothetical protein
MYRVPTFKAPLPSPNRNTHGRGHYRTPQKK